MNNRRLGKSSLRVSTLGLGCVTFGREIDQAAAFTVLDHARECGMTLLDTAAAYGDGASERVLGAWLTERRARDGMIVATKVGKPLARRRVLASAEASLRRLRTDRIDLFQLHTWDPSTPLEETLGALDALVRAGKARAIGCSNFAAWQLTKALWRQDARQWARFDSAQLIYNLVHREIETEHVPLCADQHVGVLAYSPLGAGFLTGKYRRGRPPPKGTRFDVIPGHQDVYCSEHGFRVVAALRAVARRTGVPMVQLALGWVLRQRGITSVLIGARKPEHVDQAFAARALDLPPDIWEQIATAGHR